MSSDIKQCPFCAEDIKVAAVVCKHCGRELSAQPKTDPKPTPPKKKSGSPLGKLFMGLLLGVVGLTILCNIFSFIGGLVGSDSGTDRVDRPRSTAAPIPTDHPPVNFSGTGDDVVQVSWPSDQAAIMEIGYTGTRNFIVTTMNGSGESIDLAVNTIGRYQGIRPFNFEGDPRLIEIKSSGRWDITIKPLSDATLLARLPYTSIGDDVFRVNPVLRSDRVRLAHSGDSNFIVLGYDANGRSDLIANEIGTYSGVVLFDDIHILVVEAEGAWGIEAP